MAFIESSGGRPPRSARGLQQSTLERAFSGVYSLPEGGRPEARAASNRALWRGRLVAFTVFRRAAAPKRARPPTNRGLWRVRLMAFTVFRRAALQQSTLERAFSGVYRVFRRAAAPKRARPSNRALWRGRSVAFTVFRRVAIQQSGHPTEHSGKGVQWRSFGRRPPRSVQRVDRPEARAASNRALWRGRSVAFTVFRRAAAPKRARHPTEHAGEGV